MNRITHIEDGKVLGWLDYEVIDDERTHCVFMFVRPGHRGTRPDGSRISFLLLDAYRAAVPKYHSADFTEAGQRMWDDYKDERSEVTADPRSTP